MKILLDESLPIKLKDYFDVIHEVYTVKDTNWLGLKNGVLIKMIIDSQFDAFITVDKNLPYQQNTDRLPITIFVLDTYNNRIDTLASLIPRVFERINQGNLNNIEIVTQ